MKLKRIFILMIPIIILITLIPQNVFAASQRTFDSAVDHTYSWEKGIYKQEIDKDTYVTISKMRSNLVTYEESSNDNVEIEPSVGYAYYMAKSYDLDDPDMQSVIAMSDQWGNDSNMKVKGSKQSMDGDGFLYMRAKQYGDVYYGILQDAIKNNKKVLKIKDEESVNKNLKVFADQEAGTYTVGPYKLELNVSKNQYTDEASKILYNELNESGNTFYKTENAFARTNPITGINGTEVRFVDKNGKTITFPNFVPGQEQEFYIRFKPNNDGAIIETGNPIINTSYLTKFTARKLVTGTPVQVKFGDVSEKSSSVKVASSENIELNILGDKDVESQIVEQTESTLKKREYGAISTEGMSNLVESLISVMKSARTNGVDNQVVGIKKVGDNGFTNTDEWAILFGQIDWDGMNRIAKAKEGDKVQYGDHYITVNSSIIQEAETRVNNHNQEEANRKIAESAIQEYYKSSSSNNSNQTKNNNTNNNSQVTVRDETYKGFSNVDEWAILFGQIDWDGMNRIAKAKEGDKVQYGDHYIIADRSTIQDANQKVNKHNEEEANRKIAESAIQEYYKSSSSNNSNQTKNNNTNNNSQVTVRDETYNGFSNVDQWAILFGQIDWDGMNRIAKAKEGDKVQYGDHYIIVDKSTKEDAERRVKNHNQEEENRRISQQIIDNYINGGNNNSQNTQQNDSSSNSPKGKYESYEEYRKAMIGYGISEDRIMSRAEYDQIFGHGSKVQDWKDLPYKYSAQYRDRYGETKEFRIPGNGTMDPAKAEHYNEIIAYDPKTRDEMLAEGKKEGEDFIVIHWNGKGGDTPGIDVSYNMTGFDKIYSQNQFGEPGFSYEIIKEDQNGDGKIDEDEVRKRKYYTQIFYTVKAAFEVHVECSINSVTLNGISMPVSKKITRDFIVEVETSGYAGGNKKYYEDEGGLEELKKEAEKKIKEFLDKYNSLDKFGSEMPTGNTASAGWEEAFTKEDLNITIGGSSGGSSGGGSSSGGSSSGGSSSGGSSSGGSSSGDGSSSSGGNNGDKNDEGVLKDIAKYVRIEGNQNGVDVTWSDGSPNGTGNGGIGEFKLPGATINMQIGGTVWNETKELDGKKNNGENILAGVQVQLVESKTNQIVATTTTDSTGKYRFYGQVGNGVALINGLKKYYVVYTYNGQTYEATYYKDDLTGIYSNAMEIARSEYNKKFENIYSDSANYYIDNNPRKSYAKDQKIENDSGQYVDFEGRALTYNDVYTEFLKETLLGDAGDPSEADYNKVWDRSKTYEEVINNSLRTWLSGKGINNEYESIKTHIYDTFIQATTKQHNRTYDYDVLYTGYNRFVIKDIDSNSSYYNEKKTPTIQLDSGDVHTYLYSINSDQSRNVNFGLHNRGESDLALQKDVYKTTLVVNGKKEVYTYDKKAGEIDNFWDTANRTGSELYNEKTESDGKYVREIRKSDYLYNGNDAYGNNSLDNIDNNVKNLQVFVTYKIAVKNQGDYDTRINEIVDYYDSDTYEFDGILNGNQYQIKTRNYASEEIRMPGQDNNYVYSYVGSDAVGTKQSDLVVNTQGINKAESETITKEGYNYKTLYLTGIKGETGNEKIAPNETAYVYVTYKVKNDPTTKRIILDQQLSGENAGIEKIGKRSIAEINSYATYYHVDTKIPDIFMEENAVDVDDVNNNMVAGTIDRDSNPGSLKAIDLDKNGNIITDNNSNSVKDRQQDDSDKASNVKLVIDQNEDENRVRRFNGAVFEDERDTQSEKAVIGDGRENKETRVDGVTLQLVELVKNVDSDGVFNGTYSGEKIWGNYTYSDNVNGSKSLPRYASGADKSSVVISGTGLLEVKPDELTPNNGEYSFKSVPAGDFYIRFIYGDTAETAMIDDSKWDERISELEGKNELSYAESTELERLKNIKDVNKLVPNIKDYEGKELSGRNAKSYNGQDYKSTIYHAGITQIGEYGEYYDIKGYLDYDNQNAYIVDDLNIDVTGMGTKPDVVYNNPGVDKSKLYYYNINVGDSNPAVSDAKDVFDIRKNVDKWSRGANGTTLMNNRAEVMASFEKSVTYKPEENQEEAIKELMNNTYMVSQTGLINTEIERTTQGLDVKDENYGEKQKYSVDHINLGLVERPKAQLKLNKEIDNFMYINSDKGIAFNVSNNQSVSNLSFSKHEQHELKYENSLINNLRKITSASSNKFAYRAQKAPERLQVYVDPELMNPAKVQVRYKYFVENVGEVDYAGKDKNESALFYYMGVPAEDDIVSTTNAVQIVDYISNSLVYSINEQDKDTQWEQTKIDNDKSTNTSKFSLISSSSIDSKKEIISNLGERAKEVIDTGDYINRYYLPEISTYNTILTTRKLGNDEGLIPTVAESGTSKLETSLILTQDITDSNTEDKLTYNNLTEIIETSNTLGRRCVYSVPGNQRMADQSLGKDAAQDQLTRVEWVEPGEIDADSAQTIIIMPPTGEVDYTIFIIIATIAIGLIGVTAFVLKRKLKKKTNEN